MKEIYEILEQIKSDAEADLPDLLYDAGFEDFEAYAIGQSRDETQKAFFIYQDKISYAYDQNRFDLTCQIQLPGVSVADVAKYTDVVFGWIKGYNLARIDMTMIDQIMIDTWPNAKDRTSIVFFDVGIIENLDSCDADE